MCVVQMLTLEGPLVAMSQPYYKYSAGSASVTIRVTLQGPTAFPVSADVSVEMRGSGGSLPPKPQLNGGQLEWAAGEEGERSVQLDVGADGSQMSHAAAVITLADAVGGDVATPNATSVVSGLNASELTVGFTVMPNQASFLDLIMAPAYNSAMQGDACIFLGVPTFAALCGFGCLEMLSCGMSGELLTMLAQAD